MKNKELENIYERLQKIEASIELLKDKIKKKDAIKNVISRSGLSETEYRRSTITKIDFWINKIGIGLLLFGVAYFFKYSLEQGWITPVIQSLLGFLLGSFLLYVGFRLRETHRAFSQVMSGGGIATLYITVFASYQILKIFPFTLSFIIMIFVSIISFVLSIKFEESALAVIGSVGGLMTPLVLYTGRADVSAIVIYTCLILAGSCVIFYFRGWPALVWLSLSGGWIVFAVLLNRHIYSLKDQASPGEQWIVQAGILVLWLLYWITPLIKNLRMPDEINITSGIEQNERQALKQLSPFLIYIYNPLLALMLSINLWHLSNRTWGIIILAASVCYFSIFMYLRINEKYYQIAWTQFKTSLLLVTISFIYLFSDNILLIILSLEAMIMHVFTNRTRDRSLQLASYCMFLGIRIWVVIRLLFTGSPGIAVFRADALANGIAILALIISSRYIIDLVQSRLYFLSAHILLLFWLYEEISLISDVGGFVTVAWFIYTIILYIISYRYKNIFLGRVSLATLFFATAKLFIIDLSGMPTLWKFVIFISLGMLLLIISYYMQKVFKKYENNIFSSEEEIND